jgi:hypothetical protein
MRKNLLKAGKSTRGPRFVEVLLLVFIFAEWLQLLLPLNRCGFASIEVVLLLWPATAVAVLLFTSILLLLHAAVVLLAIAVAAPAFLPQHVPALSPVSNTVVGYRDILYTNILYT